VQQAVAETQRQVEALRVELAEKQLVEDGIQTKLQTVKDSHLGFAKKYGEMRVAESGRLAAGTMQVVAGAAVPEEPVKPCRGAQCGSGRCGGSHGGRPRRFLCRLLAEVFFGWRAALWLTIEIDDPG